MTPIMGGDDDGQRRVLNPGAGWYKALREREAARGGTSYDIRHHGTVHRHQGPVLRGGVSSGLHLRRGRPLHDQPRGMHRLRRLRAGVPCRGHLPRGRGPRGYGELHYQGRQLLRVERGSTAAWGGAEAPPLIVSTSPDPGTAYGLY